MTYRIHNIVVQTNKFIQNQFIFSVSKDIYYLDIIKRAVDILERTKKDILNLNKEDLEKYLEKLETRSGIKLDNPLGRMKYNALRNIYIYNDKINDLHLENDINNLNLVIAIYNIDEIDLRRECKEFDVEII